MGEEATFLLLAEHLAARGVPAESAALQRLYLESADPRLEGMPTMDAADQGSEQDRAVAPVAASGEDGDVSSDEVQASTLSIPEFPVHCLYTVPSPSKYAQSP